MVNCRKPKEKKIERSIVKRNEIIVENEPYHREEHPVSKLLMVPLRNVSLKYIQEICIVLFHENLNKTRLMI